MSQQFYSPLRYPGGKGKLLPFVKDLILHNQLDGGAYAEPFAGGASVALGLLFDDYVSEVHINDIDIGIYSFWHSVLSSTEEFLKLMWDTPLTIVEWQRQRHIYKNPSDFSALHVGFAAFYLNRTNRSGVLNSGVIGGNEQNGTYKIDARFNKRGLEKRISRLYFHRGNIKIYNQDALDFLDNNFSHNNSKCLIFLDPPYYVKGKRLYTNFYKHKDHEKVSKKIKESKHNHWIITYDKTPEIDEIYDLTKKITYSLRYSISRNSQSGTEFLIYSDRVKLPYHPNHFPK